MGTWRTACLGGIVILSLVVTGCKGESPGPFGGNITLVAGRIAGTIIIQGAVPVTGTLGYLQYESDVNLAVYPHSSTGYTDIAAAYDLPELGQRLLGTNGTLRFSFQFDDLPPGDYQLGLFSYTINKAEEADYQTYWFSSAISLSVKQPGLINLEMNAHCLGDQPTGTISGRIPLTGQIVSGNRLVVFRPWDQTWYMWPAQVDSWNRLEFSTVKVPVNSYELRLAGLSTSFFGETDIIGNYGVPQDYQADIGENQHITVGYVSNTVAFTDATRDDTTMLGGQVLFSDPPDTTRDTLICLTNTTNADPPYDVNVDYFNPQYTTALVNTGFFLDFLQRGNYTIRVLSLGNSPDDVVELGAYAGGYVIDDSGIDERYIRLDKIIIGDHCDVVGTLELFGPVPGSGCRIGAFPVGQHGYRYRIVDCELISRGKPLGPADDEGKRSIDFELPGLPPGSYEIGIYNYGLMDWNIESYRVFWLSEPLTISNNQPDIDDLLLQANCMGEPPYGSLSGRLFLCGNKDEDTVPQLNIKPIESELHFDTFLWVVALDRWGRANFNIEQIPIGEYQFSVYGLWEGSHIQLDPALDIGNLYAYNNSGYTHSIDTAKLEGTLTFHTLPDTGRDYMVVAESVSPTDLEYTWAVDHLDTSNLVEPDTISFTLGFCVLVNTAFARSAWARTRIIRPKLPNRLNPW